MEGGGPNQVQNVTVTQVVRNDDDSCAALGCGGLFAVMVLIGLAVEYWYIAVPVAVILIPLGVYLYIEGGKENQQVPTPAETQMATPGSATPLAEATTTCDSCGTQGLTTVFCPHCGAAQRMSCAGCERTGLTSAFCPDCGSATYKPPTPT